MLVGVFLHSLVFCFRPYYDLRLTVIFLRQVYPLDARSLLEDLATARTVHKPCCGKQWTALTTTRVNKSYTVLLGWQIRATTCGKMVNSYRC